LFPTFLLFSFLLYFFPSFRLSFPHFHFLLHPLLLSLTSPFTFTLNFTCTF
jgi:hypothetical protein